PAASEKKRCSTSSTGAPSPSASATERCSVDDALLFPYAGTSTSAGPHTVSFCSVRTYDWLSLIWHSVASHVSRFMTARPTVGEMPRDSMTPQMICWPLKVDVPVFVAVLVARPEVLMEPDLEGVLHFDALVRVVEAS